MAGLVVLWASSASACIMDRPFNIKAYREADVIMRAKIVGYQRHTNGNSATLTLRTLEGIRPPHLAPTQWEVDWVASGNRDIPERWVRGERVIVGLKSRLDSKIGKAVIEVVDYGCGPLMILPDTTENRAMMLRYVGQAE